MGEKVRKWGERERDRHIMAVAFLLPSRVFSTSVTRFVGRKEEDKVGS